MKLILVVLISLIFVNGCIDDSEAEDPPPAAAADIYIQAETFNILSMIKRDDVSHVRIVANYSCRIYLLADKGIGGISYQFDELFAIDQDCIDNGRMWVEERIPSVTGSAWHHNDFPPQTSNGPTEYHYIKRASVEMFSATFSSTGSSCIVALNPHSYLYPLPSLMATAQDCKDAARMWFESNFNVELLPN